MLSIEANTSLGAPSSLLWGLLGKEGLIRFEPEVQAWTEEWLESQVGSCTFMLHVLAEGMVMCVFFLFFCSGEFSIWTREAGAGGLSIAVEGPSKAEITFEDRKDGSCGVSYVVQEPGENQLLLATQFLRSPVEHQRQAS